MSVRHTTPELHVKMKLITDATSDIYRRSICLFHEYHGLYEDDYEDCFYYDPETDSFGSESWSTAWAGGCCPRLEEFAATPEDVYEGRVSEALITRIREWLRESILEYSDYIIEKLMSKCDRAYNSYSYQREGYSEFIHRVREGLDSFIKNIDDIKFLLLYSPDVTCHSYKNAKWTLTDSIKDGDLYELLVREFGSCLVPKRERAKKYEGTCFEGEVISVHHRHSTYGYRSDWKDVTVVGARPSEGKTFWFNAPAGYDPERGETVRVWSKDFTEYDSSFKLRRPVVEVPA